MMKIIGSMKLIYCSLLSLLITSGCLAQSFIFDDAESYENFDIRKEGNRLICFYKTTSSDDKSSYYRTITFDSALEVVDTTGFRLPGICSNLGSGENDKYIWHIFHTVLPTEVITFLITDKTGAIVARWEKNAEDFKILFGKNFKSLSRLSFKTAKAGDGYDSLLLIEPVEHTKSGMLIARGRWMGLNILNGNVKWQLNQSAAFAYSKAFNGAFVAFKADNNGLVELHYYSLIDGKEVTMISVNPKERNRTISVYEVNKDEIVVAGRESEKGNSKHSKFFLTRFDYSGHRVFDKTDTVDRLGGNRLMLLGGAQDSNGDLILIGESYKTDSKARVAGIAASVALTVLTGGPNVIVPKVKTIVLGVVSARISPNGDVKEFHLFPVDRRTVFSELFKDDKQVYLRYQNLVLWYDLTDLATAPRAFSTLSADQEILTFSGNLIGLRKDDIKQEIILESISKRSNIEILKH